MKGHAIMRLILFLVYGVIVVFGLVFSALNSSLVQINLVYWNPKLSLSLIMACCVAIGLIFGIGIQGIAKLKLRRQLRQIQSKLTVAEEEITNLRVMAIKE